jgi:penicillin-binding protein 1A
LSTTTGHNSHPSKNGKRPTVKKKKSKARIVLENIGKGLLTVFLVCVITCTLIGGALAIYIINYVTPQKFDLDKANLDSTTIIYAINPDTNKPEELTRVSGEQNRIWVSLATMPKNLQNAFVCTEDQRFYEHNGVDWKRTTGSFINLFIPIYNSKQGGSTIDQQLVNNLAKAGKNSNDYARKIQEIRNALQLEKDWTKPQILEAYLNTINLNEGCYGVETAAQNYFGKSVKDLNLTECAALAALPKAPSKYDPRNHPEANATRRKIVLQNMLEQGKITKSEYDSAIKAKLKIAKKSSATTRTWFEDMVINDVQNDLEAKYGWTADYALNEIYTKGLRIYTTMNKKVQAAMDKVYKDTKNADYWYQYGGSEQPQSAMMIVDYSGNILGVEGGRGTKSGNFVLNRAISLPRQPGSSIKPLGVYAPAIELNKISWSSLISRQQIIIDGKPWPQNDSNSGYDGSMTVVSALAQSINTVAVNIENNYLSPNYTFDFLKNKLGFTSLVDRKVINNKVFTDKTISIAIGALTNGVTVKEMCGGYEIFGNGGVYYKPHSYTKVLDCDNNVLLQNTVKGTQAISPDTAFVMNKLLQQNVQRPDGTGQRAKISGVPVGGKTGTTNDHKDRWFCGITPDYVGVVWFGYDHAKDIPGYTYLPNPALVAWKNVMVQIEENPKTADFPSNGDVVCEAFDPKTGYITSKGTEMGWYRTTGIFPTAPVPSSVS